MSVPKILTIGCGIVGPIVAVLLKRKGCDPVVFEKVRHLEDAGVSLMLTPNGLKVFHLLGLTDEIYNSASPVVAHEDYKVGGTLLGSSDLRALYRSTVNILWA